MAAADVLSLTTTSAGSLLAKCLITQSVSKQVLLLRGLSSVCLRISVSNVVCCNRKRKNKLDYITVLFPITRSKKEIIDLKKIFLVK